jgi:cob(I)alamin adenosyltransferase
MTFRIYTKTGDKGETSLIGGTRVPKHHLRIEAYGTVDELNSYIGLIIDSYQQKANSKVLYQVQDRLFTIGSMLATEDAETRMKIPGLKEDDVVLLENEIDKMDLTLPELKSFILPGGTVVASQMHVARCICRRAERMVVHLSAESAVDALIIRYLNRLSDYLFTFARKVVHESGASEIEWKPVL